MNDRFDIDAALEDLYAVEPALRAQDAALRALARELLAARPDARIDEAFVERLRRELSARASARPAGLFHHFFTTMSTTRFLVPGLAIVAIAAVGAVTLSRLGAPVGVPMSGKVAYAPTVERVGTSAFGALSAQSGGERPQSGGGGVGLGAGPTAATAPMGGGGDAAKMIAPGDWTPTYFRHTYKGEEIVGLSESVDVYRRVRGGNAGPVSALLGSGLGLMDLSAAKAAGIQSFNLAEDRPNGYVINVNVEEGTINIYENYAKWNYPERSCTDQACIDSYRLKESDMLPDDEVVRIADAFLAAYGVSKDGYGAPIVRDEWRAQYARTADKASFWFPDVVTVVYPQLVDGQVAVDETGMPYGLNVSVNVRHKVASGLWNLSTRNFQVSAYSGETDAKRLIGIAEKGGLYGDASIPDGAKVVDVELGTPTVAYARMWQWNGSQGNELMVPTLVFPVLNAPADYWRSTVTVPLAKDLLQVPGGGPIVMPLEKAAE